MSIRRQDLCSYGGRIYVHKEAGFMSMRRQDLWQSERVLEGPSPLEILNSA